ncbi:MAG TPA: hypothetical protein DEO33_02190 [Rikenellaceae bacterium]|nr:hypothetical protein [Rikenellaceae bacterium]
MYSFNDNRLCHKEQSSNQDSCKGYRSREIRNRLLFGGLSLGILISIITKSQIVACQVSLIVSYLPALLLSGFMFSIYNMPKPLQFITYIIPARYFVTILKGIFLKGNTISSLFLETILLTVFGIAAFVLSVKRFKKRIE